jgi:hypothetical protein
MSISYNVNSGAEDIRQRIRISAEQFIVTNGNQYDRPYEQRQLRSYWR